MGTTTDTTTTAYTTQDVMPKTFGLFILYVDQWAKAVDFYRNTLGWTCAHEEAGCWAEFATGGVRFALHPVEPGTKATPIDTGLSFFVADVDATVAALKKKGVTIRSQPHEVCEGLRSATFADPFGNAYHCCGK